MLSYRKQTNTNLRLRVVTFYRNSKRVADSEMAAAEFKVNGLMRAVESVFASSNRRGVPVTVQLICMYEAERAKFFRQLGWYRRYLYPVPIIGTGFFLFSIWSELYETFEKTMAMAAVNPIHKNDKNKKTNYTF